MKLHTKKIALSRGERGMTLVELMIAMVVLAVGLAGVMMLVSGSIASNSRNKRDTTATNLSQMVLERIAAAGPTATATFDILDCANVNRTINPTGSITGLGAALDSSGNISFSTAPNPASYSVDYVVCGASGTQTTYNIRWRIQLLPASLQAGSVPMAKMVTVSSRQMGNSLARFFVPPVTLRTVVTQ